ncbi:Avirulence (Avh) protein [Phytophthora megakarya]|uniref:RxLR effector protein n=1 Tax=Phytophthora megakarya TaxID=4795 RepID=A0A225WYX5_9STRA|nr:Avirulence (Avh) protein [Phytophthora megakarya]
MRLIYSIAVVVAVTLRTSCGALPAKDFNGIAKNAASPDLIDLSNTRLLRRVENEYVDDDDDDNDDDDEEERGGGFKNTLSRLNPIKGVKKTATEITTQTAKVKQAIKEAADYQKMIDAANRLVRAD